MDLPPPLNLLLLLFNLTFTTVICVALNTSSKIPGCPTSPCSGGGNNNKLNISYPFWISQQEPTSTNTTSTYCGYPNFKITCSNATDTAATFADNNYTVTSINYITRTLSLVDTNVRRSPTCPKLQTNLSIAQFPTLDYGSGVVNLTFFYDCNTSKHEDYHLIEGNRVACLSNNGSDAGGRASYVFSDVVTQYPFLYEFCEGNVVAPVLRESLGQGINLSRSFVEVLGRGFSLRWGETQSGDGRCYGCELSEGRCGRKNLVGSESELVCFCGDGRQHRGNCSDGGSVGGGGSGSGSHTERVAGGKINVKLKVIIAVCSLCGGFTLASIGFLAWLKHRKKKQWISSLTKTLRSTSFMEKDPESLSNQYQTHVFSYDELKEATEDFASFNELGDGGFGTVYKGRLRDGRVVAVKRLYENNYKRVEQFMNEVSILNHLRHKNLVTLYGCTSQHSRELLLVYEFVPNGTVADHLHGSHADERALTWPIRLNIAIETAGALTYLHAVNPQIIHRDVKTNNILLDDNFHVKVGDFGLSRLFPSDVSHVSTVPQGTPGYVDPEYHQCYKLTDKSDVYSFGVVLVELLSSMPAVDISRHRYEINLASMAINKIQNSLLHELVDKTLGFDTDKKVRMMIESVAEIAFRCLQAEKEMRPSMDEVLELLEEIANRNYKEKKLDDDDDRNVTDDATLLQSSVQLSPDSVATHWVSTSTTSG